MNKLMNTDYKLNLNFFLPGHVNDFDACHLFDIKSLTSRVILISYKAFTLIENV